jgi:putative membrane protein
MTGPAAAPEWRHLHPLTPWFRGAVVIVVLVGAALNQTLDDLGEALDFIRGGGIVWVLVGVLAIAVVVTAYGYVWWRFARFRVGADKVELRTGFIFRQQRSFRLDQLEAVDIVHPLVARFLGLAKLTFESAGGQDSKLDLAYLKRADAEAIRADLLHRRAAASTPGPAVAPGLAEAVAETVTSAAVDLVTPTATTAPDEAPLFQVPPRWTVRAFLRTLGPWVTLALALGGLAAIIAFTVVQGLQSLAGLIVVVPLFLMPVQVLKTHLLDEMWFTAFTHPDGLRLRHGLTTTINQTIPASRIQAVRLSQGPLWRAPDWWDVDINVAGYGLSTKESRTTLVPVADPGLAALAIGAVLPEAVRPETWALVDEALHADRRSGRFTGPPARARLLDPWTWPRQGYAASAFALVIRRGRFRRVVDIVPHARIQTLAVQQGPWQRRLGLASVTVSSMPGPIVPYLEHLDAADAARFLAAEAPKTWFPARFS